MSRNKVINLKLSKKRYFNTDINIIQISNAEIRLEATKGIPNKREYIKSMFGNPQLNEITAIRFNVSFFNTQSSISEEMGIGYGDCFVNVGYDGTQLYFEPNIPKNVLWNIPSAYMLLRNGNYDNLGESGLKTITGSNPRTMWGQDSKGSFYVMISEGRKVGQKGLTAQEQREVCRLLGLKDSINADGGGSSVAFVYDKQIGNVWDGRKHGGIIIGYKKYTLAELPSLRKGCKGVYVHLLQRLLGIDADGSFGNGTRQVVMDYQKAHGLKVDGIVGKQTWTELTKGVTS